mmetsp:Transcript_90743/g.242960  ORF Transcript_90743/g.242960 Transcript_90743/m.242960 type:complete len:250 (-) Transcript_90743:1266-2015(-)
MAFTKTITLSWRISVATVKSRTEQNPKIATTRFPGTMTFAIPASATFMLLPIISAPASPNPSASKLPILMIVFSNTTVSKGSGARGLTHRQHRIRAKPLRVLRNSFRFLRCSFLYSSSPSFMACRGSRLIRCTLAFILSIGANTRVFASLENIIEPPANTTQMKQVLPMFNNISQKTYSRESAWTKKLPYAVRPWRETKSGATKVRSSNRRSDGHGSPSSNETTKLLPETMGSSLQRSARHDLSLSKCC